MARERDTHRWDVMALHGLMALWMSAMLAVGSIAGPTTPAMPGMPASTPAGAPPVVAMSALVALLAMLICHFAVLVRQLFRNSPGSQNHWTSSARLPRPSRVGGVATLLELGTGAAMAVMLGLAF